MTQDIYAIEKNQLRTIIKKVASHHFGLAFGKSNPDEILSIIDGLKESRPGIVRLARIAQKLRSLETPLCPGNANFALNEIIKEMNKVRIIEPEVSRT